MLLESFAVVHVTSNMEKLVKEGLKTSKLEPYGRAGGGCINSGRGFSTDSGKIFVKCNDKTEVGILVDLFMNCKGTFTFFLTLLVPGIHFLSIKCHIIAYILEIK